MKKIHIYTSKDNQKLYRFLIIPYYLLLIGLIFLPMGFIFIDSLQDNNVSGSLFLIPLLLIITKSF